MPDPRRHKRKETKKSLLFPFLIFLIISVGAGVALYYNSLKKEIPDQAGTISPPVQKLEPEQAQLQDDETLAVPPQEEHSQTDQTDNEQEESASAENEDLEKEKSCSDLGLSLTNFFSHVDNQFYMTPFKLEQTIQQHFITLTEKVLNNPPVVVREYDDLFTVLKNMAHFFRILGNQNIIIIKTILNREADKIEDVTQDLFHWTTSQQCSAPVFPLETPLIKLYEYAGFFTNTMGGRSYLFRRDSRSRLIINYYSILIIDIANEQNLNKYGIDITPITRQLIQEIEATNQLIYKEKYLETLDGVLEKYQTEENVQ